MERYNRGNFRMRAAAFSASLPLTATRFRASFQARPGTVAPVCPFSTWDMKKKPSSSRKPKSKPKPPPQSPTAAQDDDEKRGFGRFFIPPPFKFTGKLRPGGLSPPREIPDSIARPDYWKDGHPKAKVPRFSWDIRALEPSDVEKMRVAGRLAREVLDIAGRAVAPGVTTDFIDGIVHTESVHRNCYPSPLNYQGFPKSCCTSINEVICHGIPCDTTLVDGDIVNIDVTVFHDGFHGDCSETFLVGDVDDAGRRLVRVTYDCLEKAIAMCRPGFQVSDIGGVIEDHAHQFGYTVVRNFCGHGVNSVFHTTPNVLHYRNNEPNGALKKDVTFTIEPMINEGLPAAKMWPDDWTATTIDGKRSAQFEHTLLVTEDGVEKLTGKIESSPKYFWEEEEEEDDDYDEVE